MPLAGGTFTGDVTFDGETAGRDIVFDRSDNSLEFLDNSKLILGSGADCQLLHDGTDTFIQNKVGDLKIANNVAGDVGGDIFIQAMNGEDSIKCIHDGAVELYHDNAIKFKTRGDGVNIYGHALFGDNNQAIFGAGNDLKIYHDGSNSYVDASSGTGDLYIKSADDIYLIANGSDSGIDIHGQGAVELFHNNSKKLETTSTGVTVTGALTATGNITAFSDETLKTDINTINNALGTVGKLRGVSYKWKENNEASIGVIAQEVEQVIPEVVHTSEHNGKEVKSVDYGKMVGVLIEAIKELKAEVEELKGAKL